MQITIFQQPYRRQYNKEYTQDQKSISIKRLIVIKILFTDQNINKPKQLETGDIWDF